MPWASAALALGLALAAAPGPSASVPVPPLLGGGAGGGGGLTRGGGEGLSAPRRALRGSPAPAAGAAEPRGLLDRLSALVGPRADAAPGGDGKGRGGGAAAPAPAEAEAAGLKTNEVECSELTVRACRSDPRCFWKGRANNPELTEGVCQGARTYCEGRQTLRSCRGSADGSFNCAWEPARRACLTYGEPPEFRGNCSGPSGAPKLCSNWEDCLAPNGSRSKCSECRRGRCAA